MMMEAESTSETSVTFYWITRHKKPADGHFIPLMAAWQQNIGRNRFMRCLIWCFITTDSYYGRKHCRQNDFSMLWKR